MDFLKIRMYMKLTRKRILFFTYYYIISLYYILLKKCVTERSQIAQETFFFLSTYSDDSISIYVYHHIMFVMNTWTSIIFLSYFYYLMHKFLIRYIYIIVIAIATYMRWRIWSKSDNINVSNDKFRCKNRQIFFFLLVSKLYKYQIICHYNHNKENIIIYCVCVYVIHTHICYIFNVFFVHDLVYITDLGEIENAVTQMHFISFPQNLRNGNKCIYF